MKNSTTKVTSSVTKSTTVNKSGSKTTKKAPTEWRDRINPDNYQLLRDTFLVFDEDGSGEIDPAEISKVLQQIGLDKRNPYVIHIITAMRETNKKLKFEEFVDVVCTYTGQVRTKDGLRRVFNLYDKQGTGVIEFQQLKHIAREIGQHMTDDALLDLMHAVFIQHSTTSNQSISFDEFYLVISSYYSKKEHERELP